MQVTSLVHVALSVRSANDMPADRQAVVLMLFFFFNDTATTEIYTLSLHDALPISAHAARAPPAVPRLAAHLDLLHPARALRSEEHTSELQSHSDLVCRLLLEKKKFES